MALLVKKIRSANQHENFSAVKSSSEFSYDSSFKTEVLCEGERLGERTSNNEEMSELEEIFDVFLMNRGEVYTLSDLGADTLDEGGEEHYRF